MIEKPKSSFLLLSAQIKKTIFSEIQNSENDKFLN